MEAVRGEKIGETKPNGCTHQQEEKKQEAESRTTKGLTADRQTGSGKMELTIPPTGGDREVHHSPGFKGHAPALQAGGWGPGQRGGEQKQREKETRRKKRDSAAPNVIMQWTGSSNGGGMFCFFYFSAGEVTRRRASLLPNSGAGPQYRATSERHTHTGVDKAGVC